MATLKQRTNKTPKKPAVYTLTKREFCAHIWQYLHYVEDIMFAKVYNKTTWKDSILKQKGEQIKNMMRYMET